MSKLKSELKSKWLDALRSGKYTQAYENLRVGDAYCCLGVGAVCLGKEVPELDSNETESIYTELWELIGRHAKETLVTMNDVEKKSFSEIAIWIETNL